MSTVVSNFSTDENFVRLERAYRDYQRRIRLRLALLAGCVLLCFLSSLFLGWWFRVAILQIVALLLLPLLSLIVWRFSLRVQSSEKNFAHELDNVCGTTSGFSALLEVFRNDSITAREEKFSIIAGQLSKVFQERPLLAPRVPPFVPSERMLVVLAVSAVCSVAILFFGFVRPGGLPAGIARDELLQTLEEILQEDEKLPQDIRDALKELQEDIANDSITRDELIQNITDIQQEISDATQEVQDFQQSDTEDQNSKPEEESTAPSPNEPKRPETPT
ncbi:MAG: hypothetical protein KDD60_01295, partial [Bdellovibrionales bacterium]|nr:hypothetical protein [Bdellovibrionales bacterium]